MREIEERKNRKRRGREREKTRKIKSGRGEEKSYNEERRR